MQRRCRMLSVLTVLFCVGFTLLLWDNQMVHGIPPEAAPAPATVETVKAARGRLLDRKGRPLADNETVYQVILDGTAMGSGRALGEQAQTLAELCRRWEIAHNAGGLPLTWTEEGAAFSQPLFQEDGTPARFTRLCQALDIPTEHAPETASALLEYYGLRGDETGREALDILYPCALRQRDIVGTTFPFAETTDAAFAAMVEERNLPGVRVSTATRRIYPQSAAAHLLGQTGAITAENWKSGENYRERGYPMDAVVGVSGAEYAFEQELRGEDGTVTRTGEASAEGIYVKAPQPGQDVWLTLDLDLQQAAEQSLARHTQALNGGEGGSAVVVMDVHTGGVLAAASWPSFDPAAYREDYARLARDKNRPLFNRALLGTYAPGSTYKMVTASAALDTGIITPWDTVTCRGWMDYLDTRFHCWISRSGGRHGRETVSDALRDSCNVFFYTVGEQLGIDTLNQYAQAYGLGLPTGIELAESAGVNAGPDYARKRGRIWYPGNTLSAAIGQSDNQFTPLQICAYVSTLANGGTRYQTHLLQQVTNYYDPAPLSAFQPKVLGTVPLSEENQKAIVRGMCASVESSAALSRAFEPLKEAGVTVAAKTGSAQVAGQEHANGLFVCFAPAEEPEIALCVAVEKGGAGADTAVIAGEILGVWQQIRGQ